MIWFNNDKDVGFIATAKGESAAARDRFSLVSSLSTPARMSALDASAAAADRPLASGACGA